MYGIHLTSASISYAAIFLFLLISTGNLLNIPRKTLPTWLMAAIFYILTLSEGMAFIIVSLSPWKERAFLFQVTGVITAMIPLLQLVYIFPGNLPEKNREARHVQYVSLLLCFYAILANLFATGNIHFTLFFYIFENNVILPLLLCVEIIWCIYVLVFQILQFSENRSAPFWKKIIFPRGKEALAANKFIILCILFLFCFISVTFYIQQYLSSNDIHQVLSFIGLWIGVLFSLFYFNYTQDNTTITTKLTIIFLATVLAIFILLSPILPPSPTLLLLMGVCCLFVVFILPNFFSQSFIHPLFTLINGVKQVDEGDWQTTVPIVHNDEIGYLSQSFNNMINTVQIAAKALRQANISLEQKVTEQQQLLEELHFAHEQLQSVSRHFVETQEKERHRLAGELHDEIGQALTGIKLMLEMANKSPNPSASLDEAKTQLMDLIHRVNDISLNLRPVMLDEFGLLPALLFLFDNYTRQTGIEVYFQQNGLEENRFPSEIETAVYRIIQEALTNVARHAQVKEVSVHILIDSYHLMLEVEDHGTGFEMQSAGKCGFSYGLAGMAERASLLGGKMTIESSPDAGTFILANIPLNNQYSFDKRSILEKQEVSQ